jgi:hypothetical protein
MSGPNRHAYRAHGLLVHSGFDLPAFAPIDRDEQVGPDLAVRADRRVGGGRCPEGVIVAQATVDGMELSVVACDDRTVAVAGAGIELRIAADASTLTAATDGTERAEAAMPWFVGGLGMAVNLMMRGVLVLHASVFEVAGRAHVVIAPSGHGKSIVSAAACASGARLVAEDTVRLEPEGNARWSAVPGSTVLRSRRTVDELAGWFGAERVSRSSDQRTLVRFDRVGEAVPVAQLHLPALDPHATATTIDRVEEADAMIAVLGHLRVPGLVGGDILDRQFDLVGDLTARVPLDLVRLPWTGDFARLTEHVRQWLATSESSFGHR